MLDRAVADCSRGLAFIAELDGTNGEGGCPISECGNGFGTTLISLDSPIEFVVPGQRSFYLLLSSGEAIPWAGFSSDPQVSGILQLESGGLKSYLPLKNLTEGLSMVIAFLPSGIMMSSLALDGMFIQTMSNFPVYLLLR